MGRTKDFLGIVAEATREAVPLVSPRYEVRTLESPDDIKMVRRFAAAAFVRLGALDPQLLDDQDLPHTDTWYDRSTFFGSFDRRRGGKLVATGRIIWSPMGGVESTRLPVDQIDPTQAQRLEALPPGATAELGTLVKDLDGQTEQAAVLKLIRHIWQFATDNHIKEITCGLKPSLLPRYKHLFGAALTSLATADSPYVEYPGVIGPQVPLSISVDDAFRQQRDEQPAAGMDQWLERLVVRHFVTAGNEVARGGATDASTSISNTGKLKFQ